MTLWLILSLLAAITVGLLLWPLMRRGASQTIILAIAIVLPMAAMLLYNFLGSPGLAN